MAKQLNVLMAQINPTVAAIDANTDKVISIILHYQEEHDIIVFPELIISGYPAEDLLLRPEFHAQIAKALDKIASVVNDCYVILGHPTLQGNRCFNSASIYFRGERFAIYHKQALPNYGVFDEIRYFVSGQSKPCIVTIEGYQVGLCICEDVWLKQPVDELITAGADTIICINASPFEYNKYQLREDLIREHVKKGAPLLYVNAVGGQDELVFDGQSFAMDETGKVCARAAAFKEEFTTVTLHEKKLTGPITPLLDLNELIYKALICGTKDYVEKNNFPGVLLGLSGGIDSALTLAIAVDALGPNRVQAVMMPSRYTAEMSNTDAQLQIEALGIKSELLPIESVFESILTTLEPTFAGLPKDITEENIQARIRGLFLMALSNKKGNLVLTTSNKSETAVGYATLYGDMAGGFAVLKDVLKTQVYALAHYRNQLSPVIPERVLTRAPSAELVTNQTDQDSLPDYPILDAIITAYMENNLDTEALITKGYDTEVVRKVIRLIKRNEYKRRQAPPGIKISSRAFGRDWRFPITSGFK
ncbi:NAD synthase (glutamine-hydrolysing) [Legionella beliardensis]|uniref:Glutamine-dependent NAD(+) synthetase n=1 Tax=Legionella beliardensis TaxID=91822 RepID=A0A378I0E6_9GAMM|nr:NAD+ synthase [Legionella beliardensis]STX28667.1 NAD synthase (glutamine-hydrolysing) [Legionella beliardensis]